MSQGYISILVCITLPSVSTCRLIDFLVALYIRYVVDGFGLGCNQLDLNAISKPKAYDNTKEREKERRKKEDREKKERRKERRKKKTRPRPRDPKGTPILPRSNTNNSFLQLPDLCRL